jgi:hypothetical protein
VKGGVGDGALSFDVFVSEGGGALASCVASSCAGSRIIAAAKACALANQRMDPLLEKYGDRVTCRPMGVTASTVLSIGSGSTLIKTYESRRTNPAAGAAQANLTDVVPLGWLTPGSCLRRAGTPLKSNEAVGEAATSYRVDAMGRLARVVADGVTSFDPAWNGRRFVRDCGEVTGLVRTGGLSLRVLENRNPGLR